MIVDYSIIGTEVSHPLIDKKRGDKIPGSCQVLKKKKKKKIKIFC
jgi:hypothetical protein